MQNLILTTYYSNATFRLTHLELNMQSCNTYPGWSNHSLSKNHNFQINKEEMKLDLRKRIKK